ncbi:olfactory receptor 6N1-like [Pholidichthys leucotaenia]
MNKTASVGLFFLTGFSVTVNYSISLFFFTLLCFSLILIVNISIILTIILDSKLHKPMYTLICSLCVNGVYGSVGFYPKFASDLLSDVHVISYAGCLLQCYILYSYMMVHFSILVLMAYDRYVAICQPLQYHSLMSAQRTAVLLFLSWLVPLCCEGLLIIWSSTLKMCGSRIQKLYCGTVVDLACGSTTANEIVALIVLTFYLCHGLCIVCSYIQLVKSALTSRESRMKFKQTCVPQLFCLFIATTASLFDLLHIRYGSVSLEQNAKNFISLQFIIFPPILSPVIYGLILTGIRKRMVMNFVIICRQKI